MLDFRPSCDTIHTGQQPHFTGDDTLVVLANSIGQLSAEMEHPALEITIPSDEIERLMQDISELPQ